MSNYVVYSDASATGCGAHLDINDEQVCNKQWDLLEHRQSSTWTGICHFVHFTFFFLTLIRRLLCEKLFSDSQSACKIVQVGSTRSDLHPIAVEIFQFYATNGVELELQ